MKDPTDQFGESYWKSRYRRIERKAGWIFLIAGAVMLLAYSLREALQSLRVITFERFAVALMVVGGAAVLLSFIRERIHQHREDPYKDVKR